MTDDPEKTLWDDLKHSIRDAFSAWGEPQVIAREGVLERRHERLLRGWLEPLETIVRALLVPMALRILPTLPPRPARRTPAKPAPRPAKAAEAAAAPEPIPAETARSVRDEGAEAAAPAREDLVLCTDNMAAPADDAPPASGAAADEPSSETWTGVPLFRLAVSARKAPARGRPRAARARPRRLPAALVLARRFEALIRAVARPEPHARRLARLLARDRYAAARVLARPKPQTWENGLERAIYYADIVEDALALAWAALGSPTAAPESG